jgi:hypothetical protein
MGTVKTYALFTINQDNKIDENHECGKSIWFCYKLLIAKNRKNRYAFEEIWDSWSLDLQFDSYKSYFFFIDL